MSEKGERNGVGMATDAIDERDEDIRLLRVNQVLDLVPVSRVTLWRWVDSGEFPKPTKMGGVLMWANCDIRRWKEKRFGQPGPRVDKSTRARELEDLI